MALLPGVHNRFCICSSISSMGLLASFWNSYAIFKAKNWSSIRFLHSADTQSLQNVAWKLSRYLDSLNFPPKAVVVLIRLTGVNRRSSWNSVAVWFHGMGHSSYLTPCFQNKTVPHLVSLWELKLGARCDFLIRDAAKLLVLMSLIFSRFSSTAVPYLSLIFSPILYTGVS